MTKIKNMLKKGFTLTELAIVIAVIAILVAVLVPTFISLIDSANESKDTQMIYNVNQALSIENATNSIETPEDALNAAAEAGYNIDKLTPTSDSEIYYDQVNVQFVIKFSDGSYYPASASDIDLDATTTWHFVSTNDLTAETDGSYTIEASYSVILTNNATTTESSAAPAPSKLSVGSSKVAAVAEESITSGITINYKGMGSIDTSKADNIASINYTYTTTEGVTATEIIFNTTALTVNLTTSSNITINSYNSENTITKIVKAESSGDVKVTINDNKGSAYQGDDSVITVNGDEATVVGPNVTVDTASGTIQLGTEKYPWLITDETKLAEKLGNSTLKTVYLQLQNDITLSASTTVKDITSNIVIDGKNNYTLTSSNADFCLENTAKADLSVKLINLNTDKTNIILLNYESVTFESCKIDNSKIYIIGSSSTGSCNVEFSNSKISNDAYTVTSKYGEKDVYLIEIYSLLNEDGQGNDLRLNITSCVINVCGEELFNLHGTSTSGDYGDFKNIDLVLNKVTATLTLSLGDSGSDSFHKLAVTIGTADEDSMYFALINISKTSYTTDCSDSTFCYITLANSPTTYTIKDQDVVNLHSASDFTASAE